MEKILISFPDDLAIKFRAIVPARQRSNVITKLVQKELSRRDNSLMECARAVEQDSALNDEMKDWDASVSDGIKNETW